MKSFRGLQAANLSAKVLRDEIDAKGYALVQNVVPIEAIHSLLADVTHILSAESWLSGSADPLQRIPQIGASYGDPDPDFKRVYQEVFNLESFHTLPHQHALKDVMKMLVGDQLLIHPKPIGRLIFPNCDRLVVQAHQDYEFMGGDPEFFTVWIPLHDCPIDMGALRILEGSHRYGVQQHQHEDLHVPEIPLDSVAGDEWAGGPLNAGDVLIFHSLTVHAASPNISQQMRISLDCRFQDARRVLNPSNLVFAGESGKSWEKTYAGWRSKTLQFYWKNLPLALSPSKAELENLAQTSDSPSKRARYIRMMNQL